MTWIRQIGNDLSAAAMMTTVALCVGLGINQFRNEPLPLVYTSKQARMEAALANVAPTSAASEQAEFDWPRMITLGEMRALMDANNAVILDARPEIFHRMGHIPGALSLSREEFDNAYEKLRENLTAKRSRPIIVYCSGASCEDSKLVANALVKLKYPKVFIFEGGWSEWTRGGFPEEKS